MGENSGEQSIGMDTISKVKDTEKKIDNTNYRKVTKEDETEVFVCNICNWEASEAKRVKQHITKKHRERSVDSEDEDEDHKKLKKNEEDLIDESSLEQFDRTGMITSTQSTDPDDILAMFDEHGKPLMSDETRTAKEKTGNITMAENEVEAIIKVDRNRVAKLE